jgi:periplasmic divalent cation tolerance protein
MDSDTQFVIVLTTFPAEEDAGPLAQALVDERLAACVNILPVMQSVYAWEGATEHADERQVLIKTTRARLAEVEARVSELHPYDVPEFVVIPIITGTRDYFSWLADATTPTTPN